LANWLGDTDDAVRLVTLRELLGGAPWFDITLPRIGAPKPLVSHWSRLIDAPLAVLMLLFRPLFGVAGAEIATRMVWPALLFFILQLMISREAFRRAGPWAAAFAVALPLLSLMPLVQFKPGRIDHHNAQILCAVAGRSCISCAALEEERVGWIAGAAGRLGIAGLCAVVGVVLFGAIEPACLMGPFGQVNPALKPIWLDRVMESKSILSFGDNQWAPMLAFIAFVLAGIVAQFAIWRARPTTSNALATAMIVLAAMLGCWQIKLMLYASWLAVLPLAVFAARLQRVGSLSGPIVGVCAVMLLNQSTLAAVFEAGEGAVRAVVGGAPEGASDADVGKECARTTNVARLAELSPGLIAANIDLGPHIVAMTPHRVVAAPYHRLDKGILAGHAILHGTPEEAERTARSLGVSYIVLCGATNADGSKPVSGGKYPNLLRAKLMRGEPVGFLQEIAPAPGKPIRVWRVLPAG
jgi:hypothetical protein